MQRVNCSKAISVESIWVWCNCTCGITTSTSLQPRKTVSQGADIHGSASSSLKIPPMRDGGSWGSSCCHTGNGRQIWFGRVWAKSICASGGSSRILFTALAGWSESEPATFILLAHGNSLTVRAWPVFHTISFFLAETQNGVWVSGKKMLIKASCSTVAVRCQSDWQQPGVLVMLHCSHTFRSDSIPERW